MSAQYRAGRGRPETVPEPSGGAGVRHVVFACRCTSQAGGITTVVDELAAETMGPLAGGLGGGGGLGLPGL